MVVFPPSDLIFSSPEGDSSFFFFRSRSCKLQQQSIKKTQVLTITLRTSDTACVVGVCVLKKFSISLPSGGRTPRSTPTSIGQVGGRALFPEIHSSNNCFGLLRVGASKCRVDAILGNSSGANCS